MNIHRHNVLHCRVCAHRIDAASPVYDEDSPSCGDISICIACGEVSVFEIGPLGTVLREPTLAELHEFSIAHPRLVPNLVRFNAEQGFPSSEPNR